MIMNRVACSEPIFKQFVRSIWFLPARKYDSLVCGKVPLSFKERGPNLPAVLIHLIIDTNSMASFDEKRPLRQCPIQDGQGILLNFVVEICLDVINSIEQDAKSVSMYECHQRTGVVQRSCNQ